MIESQQLSAGIESGNLLARLERLPLSRSLILARLVVGCATLFDGFTTLAIAYVMPVLVQEWHLSPTEVGPIIAWGYIGQLFGALFFGWLAERWGRLRCLLVTLMIFTITSVCCIFAWNSWSLIIFRFIQGIGTGGEVPVASAYINEFVGAKKRGSFFLFYEVLFPVGLMVSGLFGSILIPIYGWQSMFWIAALPALLILPLQFLMPESPRWLIDKGRLDEAARLIQRMEIEVEKSGRILPPVAEFSGANGSSREVLNHARNAKCQVKGNWRELFSEFYRPRTFMIWVLWITSYMINNGLTTWLPTLYKSVFGLSLQTSLVNGFFTQAAAVVASIVCALYIDKVGRRKWYVTAFSLAILPLAALFFDSALSADKVFVFCTAAYACLQTVTFSLYLYSAEIYPTRIRAIGAGFGSAWLRLGSALGPVVVGLIVADSGVAWVFCFFGLVALIGAVVCWRFMIETRGRILEEVSP